MDVEELKRVEIEAESILEGAKREAESIFASFSAERERIWEEVRAKAKAYREKLLSKAKQRGKQRAKTILEKAEKEAARIRSLDPQKIAARISKLLEEAGHGKKRKGRKGKAHRKG